ncbi:RdgB/HAM1 family non-canonical purine NTP pyrophosphatase [Sanguibacter inulinus]|uniref:dITP/XTP pyrophosphatase n=1 Tax=Sanguibacter inulinus TaxID=60922 RepID=A0A853ES05_9MICO|nr:RdgB/HAM1 family non-canonical purine NTP pyrophosphatase [Sanguibacter inulinus]MBF0722230.1 RdgB/HAM1 family non-canonical purine NTP pyrophosphatase [Sanguibacter inulinus]NYS93375.1 RdgB/HAM1 family non-canonical purine NTP pyrophosphatase [Sanguibacter inulinus]
MTDPRLVLATHNDHKVGELRAILLAAGTVPGLLPDEVVGATRFTDVQPVEDGVTFEANALIKARALAAESGLPSVADDSGLAVDVLGGAPGIFSARWAGRHGDDRANLDLLLAQLGDIAPEHRRARFVCAAALVTPEGVEHVVRGELVGTLLTAPRGDGGFGYDPILLPEGYDRSCAELSPEEKNAISHRGQAFRALAPTIADVLRG